jgi:oxygen-dependent protoporphyrinogen oxidase
MQTLVNSFNRSFRLNPPPSYKVDSLVRNPNTSRWVLNLGMGLVWRRMGCRPLWPLIMANLVQHLDSTLSEKLRLQPYASTATVNLAYRRAAIPHSLDGFGFVVPAIERRQILACTFVMLSSRVGPRKLRHCCEPLWEGPAAQGLELEDREMIRVVRQDLHDLWESLLSQSLAGWNVILKRWLNIKSVISSGWLRLNLGFKIATLQLAGNAFTGAGIPTVPIAERNVLTGCWQH